MRKLLFLAKRSFWILFCLFVFVVIIYPFLLLELQKNATEIDSFELQDILPYIWMSLCFLSCLWPMDILRLYIETPGNEILLKDNPFPLVEAAVFGVFFLLSEIVFFLQIASHIENGVKTSIAIIVLSLVFINLSIALYSLSGSYILTSLVLLLTSAAATLYKNRIFDVVLFPNETALEDAITNGAIVAIIFLFLDIVSVRKISFR